MRHNASLLAAAALTLGVTFGANRALGTGFSAQQALGTDAGGGGWLIPSEHREARPGLVGEPATPASL